MGKVEKTRNTFLKILSLIIINVIFISLVTPLMSIAATDVSIRLESSATQLKAGDTVSIDIIVENDEMAGFSGFLDYDTTIFETVAKRNFVISEELDSGDYGYWTIKYDATTKKFMITEDSGDAYNIPNGVVATLNLNVIADADTSNVSFTTVEVDGRTEIDGDGGYHEIEKIEVSIPKISSVSHTVTYDYATNGGTSATKTTAAVAENAAIDLTATATKSGWNFIGWNTDKNATTGLSSLNMNTNDVTLYAIYSKQLTATCYYYDSSARQQTRRVTGTIYNKDTDVSVNLPTLTEDYIDALGKVWTRNGWTTSNSATKTAGTAEGTSITINGDINYYMLYKRNINVRYHINGGNSTEPSTQAGTVAVNSSNISSILGEDITISNVEPTKVGYTFNNAWNTTTAGNGTSYTKNTTYNFTEDVTLYAEWNANTNTAYKVEHYKQNGDGTYPTTASETENKQGTTATTATAVAKTYVGYTEDTTNTNRIMTGTIAADGSLVLKVYYKANTNTAYKVEHYKQNIDGTYPTTATEIESKQGTTGATAVAVAKTYVGYSEDTTNANRVVTGTIAGDGSLVLKVYYKANTNTAYKVEHYKQNGDGTYPTTATETESKQGTTGATATAVAKTYVGYSEDTTNANRVMTGTIAGDGSLVLKVYYKANTNTAYKVEHYKQNGDGTYPATATETESKQGTTGATVSAVAKTYVGYSEDTTNVNKVTTGTIAGDGSLVLKVYYKANTNTAYKVEHYKQNGDGTYPITASEVENKQGTTATTATAVAKTYAGYTEDTTNVNKVTTGTIAGDGSLVLKVYYKANTNTEYKVEHYKQNADGTYPTTASETESKQGTTGATATAVAKTYAGYTEDTTNENRVMTGTIAGDRSLVLKVYYKANTNTAYKVEHYKQNADGTYPTTASETESKQGTTGATVSAVAKTYVGYTEDTANVNKVTTGTIAADGSLVLKVYYKNVYTITFDYNDQGVTASTTKEIADGDAYGELPTPTRTGYTFNGWYTAATAGDKIESTTTVTATSAHTLYAQWTAENYTVTLDVNEGNELTPNTITVTYGSTYGDLVTPTRTGYTFNGWYTAAIGGDKVEGTTAVTATSAHTLYAQWTAETYTVTLDVNGGDALTSNTVTVTFGSTYGDLATPTRTGYTFAGWYTASVDGTQVTSNTTVSQAGNHTLYAHWGAESYDITLDVNGGDALNSNTIEATLGGTYTNLPTLTRTGYTFAGWYTAQTGGTKIENGTTVADSTIRTLYAQWTPNTDTAYKVEHYKQNGDGTYPTIASETENKQGTTGETATAVAKTYVGYTEDTTNVNKVTTGTIAGDGSLVLKVYYTANTDTAYKVEHYKQNADGTYPTTASETENKQGTTGATATAVAKIYAGYTEDTTNSDRVVTGIIAGDGSLVLKVYYTANTDTAYKVEHYKQNADGTYPTIASETENKQGTTGATATAVAKTYVGYTEDTTNPDRVMTGTIAADGSLVLKVYYEVENYTVTLDVNGGDALTPNTVTVTYGSTYGDLVEPTRTGYTFAGWYTAAIGGDKIESTTAVTATSAHTLYAQWTVGNYIVTLDVNGGDALTPNTVTVIYGSTYGDLVEPTRTGYTFDGWYTAAIGGDKIESTTTVTATSAHTLYAQWTAENYTVTLDVNGGDALTSNTVTVIYGSAYGDLATPTRTGYTFVGWYTASIDGTQVTSDTTVTQAGDHTLYAHWGVENYDITLDVNGGDALASNTVTVTYGSTYGDLVEPTRTGYTFAGWYTAVTGGDKVESTTPVTLTSTHTLYAQWTAENYTVTLDVNGGDALTPNTVTVTYGSTYGDLVEPTRAGYTFDGWYTEATGGDKVENTTTVTATNAHTLYAQWTVGNYIVTLDVNGGDALASNTVTVTYGSTYGDLVEPTRTGYTFNGWYTAPTAGDKIESTTTVSQAGDHTLYAQWTAETYTVTLDVNEGDELTSNTFTVTYGSAYGELPTPTKTGYLFKGWHTAQTEGSKVENTTIVATAADHTLYAVWGGQTYDIILDVNEGNELTSNTFTVTYGSAYGELPTPTKTGYTFNGWYTAVIGGDKVENTTTVTATVTHRLYAQWTAANYTVTFDTNGGNPLESNTKTVTYQNAYEELPTPTKTGYTFVGWYTAATEGNKVESTTTVTATKNHVLYAHWEINKYAVEFIGKDTNGQDVVIATAQIEHGSNITQNVLREQGINIQDLQKDVNSQEYFYKYTGMETSKFYNVVEDRQVNILYEATKNSYTITFYDEDKTTVLGTATAIYGETADDSRVNPVKQEDNTATYLFEKWIDDQGNTDDLSNVIEDRNVYASYTPIYKEYQVKFLDEDGTTVVSDKVDYHYGDIIVIPENPTKDATQQYTYTFESWIDSNGNIVDLSNKQVEGNEIYTARYTQTINQYTITFYYDTEKTQKLGESTVDYGTDATYNGDIPTKSDENGYSFTFDKWVDSEGNIDDLSNVISNRDVITSFTKSPITYTIEYVDTMGADNSFNPTTYTIEDEDITLQSLPDKAGIKFIGWFEDRTYTTEVTGITTSNLGNITVYAKWDIEELIYFVKQSAEIDNEDLNVLIYYNFDEAKAYVDNLFNNGNGTALGIYDLNNDLVYYPEAEVEIELYYVKDNAEVDNTTAIKYNNFEEAKAYVDNLFAQGTVIRIYDQNNKLVYEPKEETSQIKYFVKVNKEDENTEENTFDNFNDAKIKANENASSGVKVYDINGDIVYVPEEDLYLKSQIYKIGDNNVDEYEENDVYLYRINPETTLEQFIQNCETNGTITVYKKSGEMLTEGEIIGTGMTLKDEKNGKVITLVLSVKGDIDGNGKVTATDLAAMNQQILKEINLEGVQFMSADISDDKNVTATDLAAINQVILKELDLSTIR